MGVRRVMGCVYFLGLCWIPVWFVHRKRCSSSSLLISTLHHCIAVAMPRPHQRSVCCQVLLISVVVPCLADARLLVRFVDVMNVLVVLAQICKANDVWLHVDAAWAGSALICQEHRWMIDDVRAHARTHARTHAASTC